MEKKVKPIQNSGLGTVKLLDPYLVNAKDKCLGYLLSLDSEKFLHHFYVTSGLEPNTTSYGGWERYDGNSFWNFRGHMFGHYMSALSQAYAQPESAETKAKILEKISIAVHGLGECQEAYSALKPDRAGYISAFPEEDLDIVQQVKPFTVAQNVPNKNPSEKKLKRTVWVPWYNLHKVLAGLIVVHKNVTDDEVGEKALEVASKFGDYIYNRVGKLTGSELLSTEYGAMNDALYELYNITGSPKHKKAAECFDEVSLFNELKNKNDVLPGKHANTMFPKFIGALKRYTVLTQNETYYSELTEEEKAALPDYFAAAANFWDIVVENHTFVTGGNSVGEHFRAPNSQGEHMGSPKTCETCNTHNMLKLTRELFKLTGDRKYADYYENTFINAILSSQNPETGMMTYFQPMGAGFNKVYNLPYEHFYCCTGTGIESFTKLGDSIYFVDGDNIYVNMYFSSTYECGGVKITQEANLPESDIIKITIESAPQRVNLHLRDPFGDGFTVYENLSSGDVVVATLPMELTMHPAPGKPELAAFKYGPFVLSAGLGKKNMDATGVDGVNVRISVLDEDATQSVRLPLERMDGREVKFASRDLVFSPHYKRHDERYGLYMQILQD